MTSRFAPHPEWRALAVACGLVAAVLPARAHAEEQVELTWESPPECPQEAAVRQKLRSLAGDALRTTERVSAKGRIERLDGRYRLTIAVRDSAGVKERTIDSDSCTNLAGAAAVTLGLLLGRGPNGGENGAAAAGTTDTNATKTGNDAARNGDDTKARDAASGAAGAKANATKEAGKTADSKAKDHDADDDGDDESSRSNDSAAGASHRLHLLVRAPLLTLDFARLPKPSVGLGGGLGARYAEWRFVAIGRILTDQTLWSKEFPEVGSRVSRFTAELWTCRGFRSGALELAPCFTLGLEHTTARGEGPAYVTPHSARTTAALLGGAAAAHVYLTDWLAIFASAGFAFATSQPHFSVEGLGEIAHLSPVQVSVGIGPEWIF